MAFQLSPGVNVTEKDLTTIVPAVATTNAGIVGLFSWGPCNKRVLINSENNLVAMFGTPDNNNAEWWFPAANFLGYGNNLQVVRSKQPFMVNANPKGFSTTAEGASFGAIVENDDYFDVRNVGGAGASAIAQSMGAFIARWPGAIGNSLEVQICGSYDAGASALAGGYTGGGTKYTNWTYKSEFGAIPSESTSVDSLGGTGDEFHMVVIDKKGLFTGTPGTLLEKFSAMSFLDNAAGPDGTSVNYRDKINTTSKYVLATYNVAYNDLFAGATYGGSSGVLALPANAIDGGSGKSTSFTGNNTSFGVLHYLFSAGADGATGVYSRVASDYYKVGFRQDKDADPEGYYLFADPETVDINLLIGPPEYAFTPTTTNPETASYSANTLGGTLLKDLVDTRKDCVAFLSVPNKDPLESDQTKLYRAYQYRNAVGSSSYVFIDSGYKYQYDIYNDTYRWVPLCGDIAGLCARSDVNFDPWYSPAGFNRGNVRGVVKLAFNPKQTYRDELYKRNINPVVVFPGEGAVLFGDKTAQTKSSAFDRINVRRLFIVLEKAIATAAKYSLFEFNDAFTRAQFRSLIDPFLRDVQARRGIIDYKVVCDEKNNTPEVIDGNRFVADIYIKPNRSINFIQLNFIATKTGVSFSEVGA